MFLSGLKCLSRLERQVKFAKNRCCKIKPVAVITYLKFYENCNATLVAMATVHEKFQMTFPMKVLSQF